MTIMASAAEIVFGIPELLDQIIKDVYPSDIFVFQRNNRTFRQTIPELHMCDQGDQRASEIQAQSKTQMER